MLTEDRYGALLPDTWAGEPLAWAARIVNTGGVYTSTAAWEHHELPATAILGRSRSSTLDGRTWALDLEVLASALPPLTEPLLFYQLEIDLVSPSGAQWPYFTGPIQNITRGYVEDNGSIVETVSLSCEGTLARGKDFRANSIALNPVTNVLFNNTFPMKLTGYVVRVAVEAKVYLSGTYQATVQGSTHSYNILDKTSTPVDFRGILVATDASFSTIVLPASYTVNTPANSDITLDFGAVSPGASVYVAFWRVAHFAYPYWAASLGAYPDWLLIPYPGITYTGSTALPKRRVFDTFQTYAATGTGNGASGTPILVQDPEAYKSTSGIVAVSGGPTEVLAWTKPDGTDEFKTISSVSSAGAITLTSGFSATPAVGDPIRLATSEIVRAWDLHNQDNSLFPNTLRNFPIRFFRNNSYLTEVKPNLLEAVPSAGLARPIGGSAAWFSSASYTSLGAAPINVLTDKRSDPFAFGTDNTIESMVYALLSTATSLFASTDIASGNPSGSFVKGAEFWNTTVDLALQELEKDTLAPNAFVHDRPDGKVEIGGYTQNDNDSIYLNGIISIEEQNIQDPKTAVSVISLAQESVNIIKALNPRFETGTFTGANANLNLTGVDWTNFARLFDNNLTDTASATLAAFSDVARLVLEVRHKPRQIFPMIERIVIYNGRGTLRLFSRGINESTKSITNIASSNKHIWQLTGNGETVIEGEIINSLLADTGSGYSELVLDFCYPDSSTTVGAAEVEVYARRQNAWTAYISDDTSGSPPSGWSSPPSGSVFGPSYWQRALNEPQSYRYAPTSVMRRLAPVYNSSFLSIRHRMDVYELSQLSQDECRDFAEQFLNQAIAGTASYRITAMMDPRVALGDTVSFAMPDGSIRSGIVWAIEDSGGADDRTMGLTLLDYSV